MPLVRANGIEIYFEERGSGDPLLLIMGLGGQLTDWSEAFVDALVDAGFRVIRHDNRDSGLSQTFDWEPPSLWRTALSLILRRPLEAGYDVADMADDAAGLLDALDIPAAHVVGVSMGGMIAQAMAIDHPGKVRSLCSIMSNTGDRKHGGIDRGVMAKLARAQTPRREEAPEVLTQQYALWAGSSWDRAEHLERTRVSVARSWTPKGTARQNAAILASSDRTEGLREVTAPTLVIHGLEDKLVLPSGGEATTAAVPNSRMLVFPDMGHDIPGNRAAEILTAIAMNAARADAPVSDEQSGVPGSTAAQPGVVG